MREERAKRVRGDETGRDVSTKWLCTCTLRIEETHRHTDTQTHRHTDTQKEAR